MMKDPVVSQQWLADDMAATGSPEDLKNWYKKLTIEGPKFDYYPRADKCWIITHEQDQINKLKEDPCTSEVKETLEGTRYLGGAIGTEDFKTNTTRRK